MRPPLLRPQPALGGILGPPSSLRDYFPPTLARQSGQSRDVSVRWPVGPGTPDPGTRPPERGTTTRLFQELDAGERARFLTLIRGVQEEPAEDFVDALLARGVSSERILRDLVTPAARVMGEEWAEDRCTFVDVTLVSGRLQRLVRSLSRRDPVPLDPTVDTSPVVLVSSLPRQQHTLGLLVVAEFFRRRQWRVEVGPPVGPSLPLDVVAARHVDVVALSLPLVELVPHARAEIRRLRTRSRNPSLGIVVGGPAILNHPGVVDEVEADASAPEAHLAPEVARAFL